MLVCLEMTLNTFSPVKQKLCSWIVNIIRALRGFATLLCGWGSCLSSSCTSRKVFFPVLSCFTCRIRTRSAFSWKDLCLHLEGYANYSYIRLFLKLLFLIPHLTYIVTSFIFLTEHPLQSWNVSKVNLLSCGSDAYGYSCKSMILSGSSWNECC